MKSIKPKSIRDHLIVDVRTRPEYEDEHVPGSVHIPLHKVHKFEDELEGKKVAVLCRTGSRAERACPHIPNARYIEGGLKEWKKEGKKTVAQIEEWPMDRQVRLGAGSLALIGTLLGYFLNPYWLIVPAFIGAGLTFAGITDTCGMSKVLARMPWNSRTDAVIRKELK